MAVLEGHENPVNCVRWNNVGTMFASAGDDSLVVIWDYSMDQEVLPNSTDMFKILKMEMMKGEEFKQENQAQSKAS